MNILLLTSEFAPAMGGIGTYAGEIAAAASRLGAKVTVVAPGLRPSRPSEDGPCPSRSSDFAAAFIRCGTCRPRSCWRAAGIRGDRYDVVHAADWPFFIPVALSDGGRRRAY